MGKPKPASRSRTIHQVVREICLWPPQAEEKLSHGSPNFHLRGKPFAMYSVNHHGDGRIALLFNSPAGTQEYFTQADPTAYFVPPYVGPKGWLGVELNQGVAWQRVAEHMLDAYNKVAPTSMVMQQSALPIFKAPSRLPTAARTLAKFEELISRYPETSRVQQFGNPSWRAGKKSFASFYFHNQRLYLSVWVGQDQQGLLTSDERYYIPAYTGHNGWISLDVSRKLDWSEVRGLVDFSYRHFALKRMLKMLDTP